MIEIVSYYLIELSRQCRNCAHITLMNRKKLSKVEGVVVNEKFQRSN